MLNLAEGESFVSTKPKLSTKRILRSFFQEENSLVAPIENSPKPPPQRVTLTLPAINNAKNVAFITSGENKAQVIQVK